MGWTDWFYGPGKSVKGPTPNRTEQTPSPEPIAYRQRENGLLGWLRDSLSGWLGPQHSPGTPVESEVLGERVRSGPRGIILPWFAPYMDEYTRETSGMRLAYRWMWADPNVKAAVLGKILSVCALDLNVIPAGKKKRSGFQGSVSQGSGPRAREDNFRNEEIAEFVRWNLTERVQGCVPELAWSILSGGLTDGYSVSEKVWHHESRDEYAGKYVLFALKAKDVGNDVVLETDEFRNIVGVRALRYSAGEVFSPSSFVIFRHLPLFGTPVGMSDFRAAYGRWWMLDTVLKLRAMGLEKRAMPVMLGEYETTAQKPSLESALSLVRSQTWLSVPKGVRVEALNIAGSADSMFASAVADLKEDIFLAIQGATLQALTGQEGAMRGNSKVHKSTSDLFRWYLARCLEVILNDRDNGLIRDMVDLNYVVSSYPRAVLGAIDTADLLQEAELDQRLLSMGLKLSRSELYEKYSRTPPGDPDDEMQSPGQGGPGKPPGGASGGGPGDGLAGLLGGGGPDKSPDDQPGDLPGKQDGQSADQSPDLFAESEWEESKHPRGKGGKFAGKGGGSSGGSPGGDKGGDKGAVKKERGQASHDAPAGKGEQSGDPGLPAGRGAGGVKLDEDIDWSEVTQQEAAEKLRKQATDPDRRKKERKEVVKKLSSIGSAVKWLGKAAYAKLTIVEREIFDAGYGAVKWIEHALESFKRTTQQLATTVAQERGFPQDRVERVAHAVAAADASLAWTINIPLAHQYLHEAHHIDGWAGFGLAKIGYFLPTASLAYCAYSTARNPLAMARAAWKVLTGRGAKMPSKHAEDAEPLMGQELIDALMDRLDAIDEEHGTPGVDWWYALFAGAMDQARDARKALELADATFADHPEPPDLKEITGEEIADWLDNYDGSKVGAAKNCEGCGGGCGGGASQEVSNFTRRQDHAENGPEGFESFLEERKDKSGKRYCVEPGKGRVPCPPISSSAGSGEKQKKATPAQDTPRKAGKEADKSTPDSGGGDHLDKLGMGDLRKVGEKAGVKGRSKAELADKIRSVMQGSPASREEIQSILNGLLQAGPGAGGGTPGKSSKVAVKATKDAADGVERAKSLAAKHREGTLTQGDLAGLGMGDLRALGVLVGVKGRSKDELRGKILGASAKDSGKPEQQKPAAAPEPSPRELRPALVDMMRQNMKDRKASGTGGTVAYVPEVYDLAKEKFPGLTLEEFHKALKEMHDNDEIVLEVPNSYSNEPRAESHGVYIPSKHKHAVYIHLMK